MNLQESGINTEPYKIRVSTPSDIPQIITLLKGFQFPFGEDHYRWKYLQCPWGSLAVVAEAGNDIIGHLGHVFRPFWIQNQQTLIGLKADLIVRADYRGKGVFSNMSRTAMRQLNEKGIQFSYGFPNDTSVVRGRALGVKVMDYLPFYIKILRIESVLGKLGRLRFLRLFSRGFSLFFRSRLGSNSTSFQIKEVSSFPEACDLLWKKVLKDTGREYQNFGLRTKEFLEWRFNSCPDREYRILTGDDQHGEFRGYAVIRVVELLGLKEGLIVDIFHSPTDKNACIALLSHIKDYFDEIEVDMIGCLSTDQSSCLHRILQKQGFRQFTKRFTPRSWLVTVQHTANKMVDPSIIDFKQWFLDWGDSDFF